MSYFARQSGYEVNITSKANWVVIKVKEGVRGFNIPVSADYVDGKWILSRNGQRLTVEEITTLYEAGR